MSVDHRTTPLFDTLYISKKPFLVEAAIAQPCVTCLHVSNTGRCRKALAPRFSSLITDQLGCSEHTSLRSKLKAVRT